MRTSATQEILSSFRKGLAFAGGLVLVLTLTATLAVSVETLNDFGPGDLISAAQMNANFQRLRFAIENVNEVPVGTIAAWHRHVKGTGNPLPVPKGWVECDGSSITDPDSPLVGYSVPNLNARYNSDYSKGMFLRGHTVSGETELDMFQGHTHDQDAHRHNLTNIVVGPNNISNIGVGGATEPNTISSADTDSRTINLKNPIAYANGTPRFGNETRPVNFSVVWIMKIK